MFTFKESIIGIVRSYREVIKVAGQSGCQFRKSPVRCSKPIQTGPERWVKRL